MKNIAAISMASAALAFSPAAQAETEEVGEAIEIRISMGDLDLSDPAHYDIMKQRIQKTVRAACTTEGSSFYQPKSTDWTCVRNATAAALAKMETKRARQLALNTK